MSASSGITASSELISSFADAVQAKSTRFIKVSIRNESLVHDLSVPINASFEDDLQQLQSDDILQLDTPAYILAKLDLPSADWTAINYVPDTAQVREKMLYASSRFSLLKCLGSTLFTDTLFATSKSDLTREAYASHLQHVAAPNPLSKREQEMADLRASERMTASYDGSRARVNHIGTSIGFNWSPEAEHAVAELGQNDKNLVILTIDPKTETLSQYFFGAADADSFGAALPPLEPCYALFAWQHFIHEVATREIVFIYCCPFRSPIKNRMLYSSGSSATYEAAKTILTSLSLVVSIFPRKIETSDPTELNSTFLEREFGITALPASTTTLPLKGFARPRGPPRRR
ncbi:hypothetical protein CPB84DRAFT_1683767 [Gymnopilus junonius]|uniref:ADF-H domain-containing protein n=1 Tax=Gymnopilus junonius TaxID=109634 RepID=A0A9P5TKS9_GYMJU|nr:hypothetical protein CPB84DRAFT_1683767 [Gymnopilus junonius]